VGVLQGDLYEPLPHSLLGRVDLLLANAPYVPTGSMRLLPPEARLYEPRVALDGGADGLDVVQRIVAGAKRWLAPDGAVLLETSRGQAPAVVAALECHEMAGRIVTSDDLDATVVIGSRTRPDLPDNHAAAGH
jgi:release factor glutamine methyltransferase